MIDKRPDQCQRCGSLGADGNPAGLSVTHWRCGRCGYTWTAEESAPPAAIPFEGISGTEFLEQLKLAAHQLTPEQALAAIADIESD